MTIDQIMLTSNLVNSLDDDVEQNPLLFKFTEMKYNHFK